MSGKLSKKSWTVCQVTIADPDPFDEVAQFPSYLRSSFHLECGGWEPHTSLLVHIKVYSNSSKAKVCYACNSRLGERITALTRTHLPKTQWGLQMLTQNKWKVLAVLVVASAILGLVGWQQFVRLPTQSSGIVSSSIISTFSKTETITSSNTEDWIEVGKLQTVDYYLCRMTQIPMYVFQP